MGRDVVVVNRLGLPSHQPLAFAIDIAPPPSPLECAFVFYADLSFRLRLRFGRLLGFGFGIAGSPYNDHHKHDPPFRPKQPVLFPPFAKGGQGGFAFRFCFQPAPSRATPDPPTPAKPHNPLVYPADCFGQAPLGARL